MYDAIDLRGAVTLSPRVSAHSSKPLGSAGPPNAAERIDRPFSTWRSCRLVSGGRFWYRKTVRGGSAFVHVNVATGRKTPAFDHGRVASALPAASGNTRPTRSHFVRSPSPTAPAPSTSSSPSRPIAVSSPTARATSRPRFVEAEVAAEQVVGATAAAMLGGGLYGNEAPVRTAASMSPDGRTEAFVQDYNIFLRRARSVRDAVERRREGAPAYDLTSVTWSPNSRMLATYRVIPGGRRVIHCVQSSPSGQAQPKTLERL